MNSRHRRPAGNHSEFKFSSTSQARPSRWLSDRRTRNPRLTSRRRSHKLPLGPGFQTVTTTVPGPGLGALATVGRRPGRTRKAAVHSGWPAALPRLGAGIPSRNLNLNCWWRQTQPRRLPDGITARTAAAGGPPGPPRPPGAGLGGRWSVPRARTRDLRVRVRCRRLPGSAVLVPPPSVVVPGPGGGRRRTP